MRERSGLKAKPHSAMQTHQKRKGALKRSQSEEKLIERWAFLLSKVSSLCPASVGFFTSLI